MTTPAELVGQRVREARDAAGFSQRELAETLEPYLGYTWSPQAISAAEHGLKLGCLKPAACSLQPVA